MFHKLCGGSTLKNVVLVTNMWNKAHQDINVACEKELSGKFFKPALDEGAQMVRHHNTTESAHDIIRKIVKNPPVVLRVQRELMDEGKNIIDTVAGEFLNRELKEQLRRYQVELKEVQEEMVQALKGGDEEMRQESEEAERDLQEKIEKVERAPEWMAANYAAEKKRVEATMKEEGMAASYAAEEEEMAANYAAEEEVIAANYTAEKEEEMAANYVAEKEEEMAANYVAEKEKVDARVKEIEEEKERAAADYDQRLAVLNDHLQHTPNTSEAVRTEWKREIEKLRNRVTIPIYK